MCVFGSRRTRARPDCKAKSQKSQGDQRDDQSFASCNRKVRSPVEPTPARWRSQVDGSAATSSLNASVDCEYRSFDQTYVQAPGHIRIAQAKMYSFFSTVESDEAADLFATGWLLRFSLGHKTVELSCRFEAGNRAGRTHSTANRRDPLSRSVASLHLAKLGTCQRRPHGTSSGNDRGNGPRNRLLDGAPFQATSH